VILTRTLAALKTRDFGERSALYSFLKNRWRWSFESARLLSRALSLRKRCAARLKAALFKAPADHSDVFQQPLWPLK
jgi:hypothetical protein